MTIEGLLKLKQAKDVAAVACSTRLATLAELSTVGAVVWLCGGSLSFGLALGVVGAVTVLTFVRGVLTYKAFNDAANGDDCDCGACQPRAPRTTVPVPAGNVREWF